MQKPVILPFAGGKGGVGKSIIAANVAIALARQEFHVTAIDLDLGGSNLHSYLGLGNRFPGIGHFVRNGNGNLEELLVPTETDNLNFLPGDGASSFMANITFHQKKQIINAVPSIPADYIVLDLGAGSTYNVLDFFSLSSQGIIVTTPEFPSIFSVLGFLKNLLFRNMELKMKKNRAVEQLLSRLFNHINTETVTSENIIAEVALQDSEAAKALQSLCRELHPIIIFNMGTHPDEMTVIKQFKRGLKKILSMEADYLGFVFSDPMVKESVKKRSPLLTLYPDCPASLEIIQVARRLVKFGEKRVEDSDLLLMESTRMFYDQQMNTPGGKL